MKSGIVDQHIDPSEFKRCFLENIDASIGVRHIHHKYFDARPVTQLFGNFFKLALGPGNEHEVGTRLREFSGRRRADAFRATSDDDGLVFKNHWGIVLEAQVAFDFFPKRRFPTVDFQYFGIQGCDGHGRIGMHCLIRGGIFRAQVKLSGPALSGLCQTVHRKTQVRQNFVVDDIFQKDGIRIEGVLRQDDAIITGKSFVVANRSIPV